MKYVVCLHLYIPWKFGERGSTPRRVAGPSLSFCVSVLFVCPSRYGARHRKPRRCVYALNLGGTGISPPDKSPPGKRPPGQKHPRTKIPPAKSAPGQKCPRAKDPRGKSPPGKRPPLQKHPQTKIPSAPDTQQAATYSIAAVAGNWSILVLFIYLYMTFVVCLVQGVRWWQRYHNGTVQDTVNLMSRVYHRLTQLPIIRSVSLVSSILFYTLSQKTALQLFVVTQLYENFYCTIRW